MKKLHLFGLLAMTLVLALGMALIACNSGSDDNTVPAGEGEFSIEGIVDGRDVVAMLTKSGRAAYQIATGDRYVITFKDTGDEISKGSIEYNNPPSVRFVPDDGTDAFYGYFTGTMLTIYGVPYDGKTYTLGGTVVGPAPASVATGEIPGLAFATGTPDTITVTLATAKVLGTNAFFITNGTGKATLTKVTGSGTSYVLELENVETGIVNVKVVGPEIYSGNVPVLVYDAAASPYSISAAIVDGDAFKETTTQITFNPGSAIAGLEEADIVLVNLTGKAAIKKGTLDASSAPVYVIDVEGVSAGYISVYILKDKVYSNAVNLEVFDDTPRSYTVVAVGASASVPLPSTQLIFKFSAPLSASASETIGTGDDYFQDIVPVVGDCENLGGTLTKDPTDTTGRTYTFNLGLVSPGTITIKAQDKADSGIDDKAQTVTLAIKAGETLPNTVTAMSISTPAGGTVSTATVSISALTGYDPATLASTPAYYSQSDMDNFVEVSGGSFVFTPATANVGTSAPPSGATISYVSGDGIASTSTPWIYSVSLGGGTFAQGDKISYEVMIRNPGVFMPRKVAVTYTWP